MNYRAYEPSDQQAWLKFMSKVQSRSDAWEALYLEKPTFHHDCDHLIYHNGQILGIIAGHLIPNSDTQTQVFSIEIIATDPYQQKSGIGKALIIELSKSLKKGSLITFWTRTLSAKRWYEKIGLHCIERKHQFFHTVKKGQTLNIISEESHGKKANLWCYAYSCP